MSYTDPFVDIGTFELIKCRIMGCISRFISIDFGWDRKLTRDSHLFDDMIIHRCRMCPQDIVFASLVSIRQKKRIMHLCSRMSERYIERSEVFKFGHHIMTIQERKSHILTYLLDSSTRGSQE
jgi:hypothetical protein